MSLLPLDCRHADVRLQTLPTYSAAFGCNSNSQLTTHNSQLTKNNSHPTPTPLTFPWSPKPLNKNEIPFKVRRRLTFLRSYALILQRVLPVSFVSNIGHSEKSIQSDKARDQDIPWPVQHKVRTPSSLQRYWAYRH